MPLLMGETTVTGISLETNRDFIYYGYVRASSSQGSGDGRVVAILRVSSQALFTSTVLPDISSPNKK